MGKHGTMPTMDDPLDALPKALLRAPPAPPAPPWPASYSQPIALIGLVRNLFSNAALLLLLTGHPVPHR